MLAEIVWHTRLCYSLQTLVESKPGDTDVRLRLLRSKDFLVSYDLADRVRADREFRSSAEEIYEQAVRYLRSG